jgi:hypothetical protein
MPVMLIHNVYFWLKPTLSAQDRATFEDEVKRLGKIPYLESGAIGKPAATEKRPVTDQSYDFAISLRFKTMADHDFYQKDCQDHARFVNTCKTFWEKVIVYDVQPIG